MNKKENSVIFANFALHILGILLCVVPPLVCTLMYFPLWKIVGYEHCIAGGTAFVLILCALPVFKIIRSHINSISSYVMWLICFVIFFFLSKIADEMVVISFVGFIGNFLGAICFKLAKRRKPNETR